MALLIEKDNENLFNATSELRSEERNITSGVDLEASPTQTCEAEDELSCQDNIEHSPPSSPDVLPSISNRTYSKCKRPRRGGNNKKIPEKYWNSIIRCVEYPEGVFINKYGQPEPDKTTSDATAADDDIEGELSDEEFEKLHPNKKRKILKQLKEQQETEEREELEDLEYDKLAKNEDYDTSTLVVDKEFVSYMKGDEEYVPSSDEDDESEDFESEDAASDEKEYDEESDYDEDSEVAEEDEGDEPSDVESNDENEESFDDISDNEFEQEDAENES